MGWLEEMFKAGQSPSGWLSSAECLRAAAETILQREEAGSPAYFNALEAARREAVEKSYSSKDKTGVAEVRCDPPNYLPAQLLYAFVLENVFEGMMVADNPALANETKLDDELKSHKLDKLDKELGDGPAFHHRVASYLLLLRFEREAAVGLLLSPKTRMNRQPLSLRGRQASPLARSPKTAAPFRGRRS